MGSFSNLSVFPVGYFRATCVWLLRNRKSVMARVMTLSAEVERIGFVNMVYRDKKEGESQKKTEERMGILVTQGSSLEKLLQAYIVQGGNPMDISGFMYPDMVEILGVTSEGKAITKERYPYGGVFAPKSANFNSPSDDSNDTGYGGHQGGYVLSDSYYPARLGGRISPKNLNIARSMHAIRSWANQDIKERLLELEARIIKLCDLREQLLQERDEVLMQALGGSEALLGRFDSEQRDPRLRVLCLMSDLAATINQTSLGEVTSWGANDQVALLDWTFPNKLSEYRDPLGG